MDQEKQVTTKYYENDFPVEGQLVMVECTSCEENGCYVELLEYEGKRGMIPLNEYSTSMKKSIQRAMKVGKVEAVRVIRVDSNKGYIDLSKSKVNVEDENLAKDKFAKAKSIHSIFIHVAEVCKIDIMDLYKNIVWPLYRKQSSIHPLETLKQIMVKEDRVNEFGIEKEEVKTALIEEIKRRFKRPILKTMAIFKITVKVFDGISVLKKILKSGLQQSKEKGYDIKITTLGAPDYLVQVQTATKQDGQGAIMCALQKIEEYSKELDPRRDFEIKTKPKVVGDSSARIHEIYAEENQNENAGGSDMEDDDDQDA